MVYPALYNGPVNYFARLVRERQIVLEQFDNYGKQTYRNRCRIMGPNGIVTLSIPVKKNHGIKTPLKEIRVDYDTPWQKIHWRSLVASYASSPFFQYMMDDLAGFYTNRLVFLIDLNQMLLEAALRLLGQDTGVERSDSFSEISHSTDPRYFLHPKKDLAIVDPEFLPVPYHQVFSDRFGFQANLSILDLLFNEGPSAPALLRRSLRT